MSTFEDFYRSLEELIKQYSEKGTMLKVESDMESNIIRIFGEAMSSLGRAKSGLDDVSELAFTTAEHHPYWNLLYHACQMSMAVLEKWNSELTPEELDGMMWSIDELKNTCQRLKEKQGSS
jgi:hypothetical protein